jgi:hypothetical protein
MAIANQVVPDPNIRVGKYRVLQRTDGVYVVADFTAPFGDQFVAMFKTCEGAAKWAELKSGMKRS